MRGARRAGRRADRLHAGGHRRRARQAGPARPADAARHRLRHHRRHSRLGRDAASPLGSRAVPSQPRGADGHDRGRDAAVRHDPAPHLRPRPADVDPRQLAGGDVLRAVARGGRRARQAGHADGDDAAEPAAPPHHRAAAADHHADRRGHRRTSSRCRGDADPDAAAERHPHRRRIRRGHPVRPAQGSGGLPAGRRRHQRTGARHRTSWRDARRRSSPSSASRSPAR